MKKNLQNKNIYQIVELEEEDVRTYLSQLKKRPPFDDIAFAVLSCENENIRKALVDYVISKKNYGTKEGWTKNHIYALTTFEPILAAISAENQDVLTSNKRSELCNLSVLQVAVFAGNIKAIQIILNHDADVNFGKKSALSMALERGFSEIALLLLEHGADPNKKDEDEKSALFHIHENIEEEIFHKMVGADVELNHLVDDKSAADSLIRKNALSALEFFVPLGLPLKTENWSGIETLLTSYYDNYGYAHDKDYREMLGFVVQHAETDVSEKRCFDEEIVSPLTFSFSNHPAKYSALLLDHGAEIGSDFDQNCLGENIYNFLESVDLLKKYVDLKPSFSRSIVQGFLEEDIDSDLLWEHLLGFEKEGLKHFLNGEGSDILMDYVVRASEWDTPPISVKLLNYFIELGCPVDVEYEVDEFDALDSYEGELSEEFYSVASFLSAIAEDTHHGKDEIEECLTLLGVVASTSDTPVFDDRSLAMLVFGKTLKRLTFSSFLDLLKTLPKDAVAVPLQDLSSDEDLSDYTFDVVVGTQIAEADTEDAGPTKVSLAAIKRAEKEYANLPDSVDDLASTQAGILLCSTGPLASGYLVQGVLGKAKDKAKDDFFAGVSQSQERHEVGVWGSRCAASDWSAVNCDGFSQSDLYLIALYD